MCEYPELYEPKIVTARKTHQCCEFKCKIKKGEKYELVKGRWGGRFYVYKTCLKCVELYDLLFDCDGSFEGYRFHSDLRDEVKYSLDNHVLPDTGKKFKLYRKYIEACRRHGEYVEACVGGVTYVEV